MPFVNLPEKNGAHALDKEKMQQVHCSNFGWLQKSPFNEWGIAIARRY
jgi:hypothetical protein